MHTEQWDEGFFSVCQLSLNTLSVGIAKCSGCKVSCDQHIKLLLGSVCSRSAGISAVELRCPHRVNLLWLYCSHRFVHSTTGACVDVLPSTQIAYRSQTGLAVK